MKTKFPLINGIIEKSVSKQWDIAKQEWVLIDVYETDEPDTCLCGHYPIKEICVLKNKLNHESVEVGNCCVKKVWNFGSEKILKSIKSIRKDISKSINVECLKLAFKKNIITEKDYNFYLDIWRKRNLTEKQEKWKKDINKKVLNILGKNNNRI